jgi:hypothetical protein
MLYHFDDEFVLILYVRDVFCFRGLPDPTILHNYCQGCLRMAPPWVFLCESWIDVVEVIIRC